MPSSCQGKRTEDALSCGHVDLQASGDGDVLGVLDAVAGTGPCTDQDSLSEAVEVDDEESWAHAGTKLDALLTFCEQQRELGRFTIATCNVSSAFKNEEHILGWPSDVLMAQELSMGGDRLQAWMRRTSKHWRMSCVEGPPRASTSSSDVSGSPLCLGDLGSRNGSMMRVIAVLRAF